jgi:hypothetical protein
MDIEGYGVEIHLENDILFVHATSWISQKALDPVKFDLLDENGVIVTETKKPTKEEWAAFRKDLKENFWSENYTTVPKYTIAKREKNGDITLPISDIERVELKTANMAVNGRLTITTKSERVIVLHFRRKSSKDFDALAAALTP